MFVAYVYTKLNYLRAAEQHHTSEYEIVAVCLG